MIQTAGPRYSVQQLRKQSVLQHFVKETSTQFYQQPTTLPVPFFSYKNRGLDKLEYLEIDLNKPAIAVLSEIKFYYSVLVVGQCVIPDEFHPFQYTSIEEFFAQPKIRAYHLSDTSYSILGESLELPRTTVAISDFATFRDEQNEINREMLETLSSNSHDVCACRILDYEKYFDHVRVFGGDAFLIPAIQDDEIAKLMKLYDAPIEQPQLHDFLIEQDISFCSHGICHADDDLAISYGADYWNLPDEAVAFIR